MKQSGILTLNGQVKFVLLFLVIALCVSMRTKVCVYVCHCGCFHVSVFSCVTVCVYVVRGCMCECYCSYLCIHKGTELIALNRRETQQRPETPKVTLRGMQVNTGYITIRLYLWWSLCTL